MSSYGIIYTEIVARERELARQEQVREQCKNLIANAQKKIESLMTNPLYVSFLGDMGGIEKEMQSVLETSQSDPDLALDTAKSVSDKVTNIHCLTVSKERQWADDRRSAYEEISRIYEEIISIPIQTKSIRNEMNGLTEQIKSMLEIATTSERHLSFVKESREKAVLLAKKDEKEIARREVVKKVVSVLTGRGFSVESPKIKDDLVFLYATLPSGKTVSFQITADTLVKFDFDGYDGTACKDELDAVLERINGSEAIHAEIDQFVWKNPDKIKKGSINAPSGLHANQRVGSMR